MKWAEQVHAQETWYVLGSKLRTGKLELYSGREQKDRSTRPEEQRQTYFTLHYCCL